MRVRGVIKRSGCRIRGILSGAALAVILSGCGGLIALPGGEPFGEKTYSAADATTAYKTFADDFQQAQHADWDGYSITLRESDRTLNFYRTEEYTLVFCEDFVESDYLWYDGWLYRNEDGSFTAEEMDWDGLQGEETADRMWELLQQILAQSPAELSYKYIPMADDDRHLLKAEYVLDEEQEGDFVKLSVPIHSDGSYDTVSISWEDVGEDSGTDNVMVSAAFFAFPGSTDLQAERRLWFFGYDAGLTEDPVPALSTQEKERDRCREIIEKIDLSVLR